MLNFIILRLNLQYEAVKQIALADIVIVSKTDLIDSDELDAIQWDSLEEEMSRSRAYDIVPDYDKAHDIMVEAKRTKG